MKDMTHEANPTEDERAGPRLRVVFIDDQPESVTDWIESLRNDYNCEVVFFERGREALSYLVQLESPDEMGADRLKSARGRTEPTEIIDSQIRDEHVSLTFGADLLE